MSRLANNASNLGNSRQTSEPLYSDLIVNYDVSFDNGNYTNDTFLEEGTYEHDIYGFELNNSQNIEISLSPSGGDADLAFYEDSNYNGELDVDDLFINSSSNLGTEIDFLQQEVGGGVYFAVVNLYEADSNGSLDYTFNIITDGI